MRNRFALLVSATMLLIAGALTACSTNSNRPGSAQAKPVSITTCTDQHQLSLGAYLQQAFNGTIVYADLWDENEEPGDQALLERKPDNKTWVIAKNARYGTSKSSTCTVRLLVVDARRDTIEVVKLDGTKVGKDGDSKIDTDELVVRPAQKLTYSFE